MRVGELHKALRDIADQQLRVNTSAKDIREQLPGGESLLAHVMSDVIAHLVMFVWDRFVDGREMTAQELYDMWRRGTSAQTISAYPYCDIPYEKLHSQERVIWENIATMIGGEAVH
jgi:hypothetical protein